jgi:predicted secreted protein
MRLSSGLAAAMLTISPVAGAAGGQATEDGKAGACRPGEMRASEADDGTTMSLAPGAEFVVALRSRPGSESSWRVLQFDSAVLQGIGEPEVRLEAKPDASAVGFLSRETFRFRTRRPGETGLVFGYYSPEDRTPPGKQVRLLVRTG